MEYHCTVTYNSYISNYGFSFNVDKEMYLQTVYQSSYDARNTTSTFSRYGMSLFVAGPKANSKPGMAIDTSIMPMPIIVAQGHQNLFYNFDGVFHEIKAINYNPSRFEFTCNDNFDSKAVSKLTSNRLQ